MFMDQKVCVAPFRCPRTGPFRACSSPRTASVQGVGARLEGTEVEGDDIAQHAHALVEGAVLVVLGEGVLLQEVVLQEARRLQCDLVALSQRVLLPGHEVSGDRKSVV